MNNKIYLVLAIIFYLIYTSFVAWLLYYTEVSNDDFLMFIIFWIFIALLLFYSFFVSFTYTYINKKLGRKIVCVQGILGIIISEIGLFVLMLVLLPETFISNYFLTWGYILIFNGIAVPLVGILLSFINSKEIISIKEK